MYINLAEKKDTDSLIDVLNEATLKLLAKDIKQWTYPWSRTAIEEEIAQGQMFKVELESHIVGTFMIKPIHQLNTLSINENSLYVSSIAVTPDYQGKSIGRSIINFCHSFSKVQSKDMYLDCWAGSNKLKEFYKDCGLQYLGDFPVDDYFISIFRFV